MHPMKKVMVKSAFFGHVMPFGYASVKKRCHGDGKIGHGRL